MKVSFLQFLVHSMACSAGVVMISLSLLTAPVVQAQSVDLESLKDLSLDQLSDLRVSILSKRPERLADSAAAVYVLTGEDIRRSGYSSIAEVLRLVPGLNVARVDTAEWAISSRGFNSRFANKLLVMIDGRSVYAPLFSGVYWEAIDSMLEDIERIEVIRGPGASTWGANAVNGVINIITKHGQETEGGLLSAYSGNLQRGVAARYGAAVGEHGWLRAYAKFNDRDGQFNLDGHQDDDTHSGGRIGFRGDLDLEDGDSLMLEGEVFDEDANDPWLSGGHLLFRWEMPTGSQALDILQIYYDHFDMRTGDRDQLQDSLEERVDTFDLEYRRQFAPMGRHMLVAGLGYRWQRSDIAQRQFTYADPAVREFDRFSAFIQDEIRLLRDRWYLTLGSKIEHNDFSGWEIQPSIRTRWHPSQESTLWAAVSRAVRTPSRSEHNLFIQQQVNLAGLDSGGLPLVASVVPNRDFQPEELMAYELGVRWRPMRTLGLDLSLFYNDYDQLRTVEIGAPQINLSPLALLLPNQAQNLMKGETYGMELAADWRPAEHWRLQGSYALLHMDLQRHATSTDVISAEQQDQTPHHQLGLRLSVDLSHDWELDFFGRYVDALPGFGLEAYTELDARLGWQVSRGLSLALVGRNLLNPRHQQFGAETQGSTPHLIGRELFLRAKLEF